ncbi:MAG: hypothetical protein ACT4QF_23940 [Sporichthyaceae bacterium]
MRPIVAVDDAFDRDYASDGISRFGSYVRQRAHLLVDDWEPLSPVTFAVTVWTIASGPMMSPGYVRTRPTVRGVNCRHADEPGWLLAEVAVALPWPSDLRDGADPQGWAVGGPSHADERRPALLVDGRIRIPISQDELPRPSRFAALDVSIAKRAVAVVCDRVNAHAGPVLARLHSTDSNGVLL